MGAREINEGSWYFLCVILSGNIVSYKIYKKNGYSKCFYNFMGFWGCMGVQWSKFVQAKQFLKRNSIKLFQAK